MNNNSQPNLQREAVIYDQPTSNRTFSCPPEVPFCEPPARYVTFGITLGRPAKGYPVYEKGSKHQAGYYRGSAERAPSVAPRGRR